MSKKRNYFLLLLIVCTVVTIQAQESSFRTNATIGIGTPLLDNGTSYFVGVNPHYRVTPHVSIEGQLSFVASIITGTFIIGNQK